MCDRQLYDFVMKTRSKEVVEKLFTLCTANGFFFPTEVLVNTKPLTCYNYGPAGSLLRTNLIKEWWKATSFNKYNVYPVETGTISSTSSSIHFTSLKDGSSKLGTLDHFLPTLHFANETIPFGLACLLVQRQEPDPHSHYFVRSHERTDLVLTFFVSPHQSSQWMDLLQRKRLSWWKNLSQQPAHYKVSDQSEKGESNGHNVDINFEFPWGVQPVESIVNHGEGSLAEIEKNTALNHKVKHEGEEILPHVVECRAHLEQGMLSYLVDGVMERKKQKQTEEAYVTMALHPRISGYKVAIVVDFDSQGQTAVHLQEVADHLAVDLRSSLIATLNLREQSNSLEEQLLRYDRMGVPIVVILQQETLTSGAVFIRWRTTTLKEKVNLTMLKDKVVSYITKY